MTAMVLGDLEMRLAGVRQGLHRALAPALVFAGDVTAKLSFLVIKSEVGRVLFFFETGRKERIAGLRLTFTLSPAYGDGFAETVAPSLRIHPPGFLRPSADRGRVVLRLVDGRTLVISGFDRGGARFRVKETGAATMLDFALLVPLLDTLGDWAAWDRTGESAPIPLETLRGGRSHLANVLTILYDGYKAMQAAIPSRALLEGPDPLVVPANAGDAERSTLQEIRAAAGELRDIHPDLMNAYYLSHALARLLTDLQTSGGVADSTSEDRQQVDIEVAYDADERDHWLHLRLRVPDILTARSSLLDTFLDPFLEQVKEERGVGAGSDFEDESSLRSFLNDPEIKERSLVFRVHRKLSEDDVDLVLLHGNGHGGVDWALYEAAYEVTPYPEVQVKKVKDIELLAVSMQGGIKRPGDGEVPPAVHDFVRRLAGIFAAWSTVIGGRA